MKLRYLLICILMLLGCVGSQAADQNFLVVPTQYGTPGRQMVLEVKMTNAIGIYGYQFDIRLPQGITIAKDEDDEFIADGGTRSTSHMINISAGANNTYRVTAVNFNGKTFAEREGSVCRITLNVAASVGIMAYPLSITDIEMTSVGNQVFRPANANFKLVITPKGDANGDMVVNIADVVSIVAQYNHQNPTPFNTPAADIDGAGAINTADVKAVVAMILK